MTLHAEIKKKRFTILWSLRTMKFLMKEKHNGFIRQFSLCFKFSAETKMEDIKHLVTENWEFKCQDETS